MKAFFIILLIALFNSNFVVAQENTTLINGKVISFEESFPIEGASIVVKGTKNYTGTQVDGSFSLALQRVDTILVVSYEGFATQEVKVNGGKRDYNIVLRRAGNYNGFEEMYPAGLAFDFYNANKFVFTIRK